MALIDLFIDRKKLAKANATYKARMAEIREKEELDKLSREASILVHNAKMKELLEENNERLKAAWRQ